MMVKTYIGEHYRVQVKVEGEIITLSALPSETKKRTTFIRGTIVYRGRSKRDAREVLKAYVGELEHIPDGVLYASHKVYVRKFWTANQLRALRQLADENMQMSHTQLAMKASRVIEGISFERAKDKISKLSQTKRLYSYEDYV